MKRALAVLATTVATLGLLGSLPAQAAPEAARNPVIYVHGFGGSAAEFDQLKPAFRTAGYTDSELYALDFPNTQSNETTAKQLATKVDQILAATGAAKVDIYAFSMGNLSSRYYLKNLGGSAKVGHLFGVAGPNHGIAIAHWCWLGYPGNPACPQMAPNSTFLKNLNATDETPGDTKYFTTVSKCDGTIDPPESAFLSGAVANTYTADCVKHNQTPGNAKVLSAAFAAYAS